LGTDLLFQTTNFSILTEFSSINFLELSQQPNMHSCKLTRHHRIENDILNWIKSEFTTSIFSLKKIHPSLPEYNTFYDTYQNSTRNRTSKKKKKNIERLKRK